MKGKALVNVYALVLNNERETFYLNYDGNIVVYPNKTEALAKAQKINGHNKIVLVRPVELAQTEK